MSQISEKVKEFIEKYDYILKDNSGTDHLIPILQEVQEKEGFLSVHALTGIAVKLDIPLAKVYGVVTFYNFFKLEKSGDFIISLCEGTACHVRGAPDIASVIKEKLGIGPGEMTKDGKFSLEIVRCLGLCAFAPVVMINDKVFSKVHREEFEKILDDYIQGKIEK